MAGMCAYLIKDSDKNIEEPIARIAIKRLVNKRKFIFVAEPWVYGDEDFCDELDFKNEVNSILKKSNKETAKNEALFIRKDGNSYSDSNIDIVVDPDATKEDLIKIKEYLDSHPNKTKKILVSEISKTKLSDDFINILSDYLNWNDISEYQDLSEEMLKKHANKVNWYIISGRQDLSEDFIRKHKDDINWNQLSFYHKNLSIPFIEEFINYLNLHEIIENSKLSEEFIKKYSNKLFGKENLQLRLFKYQNISPKLFEYLSNKYSILSSSLIPYIIKNQNNISKEFIEKYNKDIDWTNICSQYHRLTEPFMRKFHEYLDWPLVSKAQKLSEKFIEDFQDKVIWQHIFEWQSSLSPEFKEKWKHKLKNISSKL
jgi:hypothetical protein